MKKFLSLSALALVLTLTGCAHGDHHHDDDHGHEHGHEHHDEHKHTENITPIETDEPIKVVATFPPLTSFALNIVGDKAQVTNLVPPGTSVHHWQPRPSDVKNLADADVLIMNGLKLEEFLDGLIDAADNEDLVIIDTSLGVPTHEFGEGGHHDAHEDDHHDEEHHDDEGHEESHEDEHHDEHAESHHSEDDKHHEEHHDEEHHGDKEHEGSHEDEHHGNEEHHDDEHAESHHSEDDEHDEEHHDEEHHDEHEEKENDNHEHGHHDHHHEGEDPHIWLSLDNAVMQVTTISKALQELDPENATAYASNTEQYISTIQTLERNITQVLSTKEKMPFIVFHDAYSYFLQDFGLSEFQVSAIQEFPGREPSPTELKNIADMIQSQQVSIIFTEPQFSPKTVDVLQDEYDIATYRIDPIGMEVSADGYTKNIRNIADAFVRAFSDNEAEETDSQDATETQ